MPCAEAFEDMTDHAFSRDVRRTWARQPARDAIAFSAPTRLQDAACADASALGDPQQRLSHAPDGAAGPALGRLGSLSVRLATTQREVEAAQRLRYRVFHEEMAATGSDIAAALMRRDADEFDAICDHLLVLDHGGLSHLSGRTNIVGTYRLLRQEVADRNFGFYSAREFNVGMLRAAHPALRFLELGRSCVLKPYRDRRTIELLWHGIWSYVLEHGVDAMVGCASFAGTDPARLALPLGFLHHYAVPPPGWRVAALPGRGVATDRLGRDAIDVRAAMRALPPLIKGYLRLGARFAEAAVVDRCFGTTDVLALLPVVAINRRYVRHFGAGAERFSRANQRSDVRGYLATDC
jgi:L-ornithine Nalpha-acyltransferase